MLPKKAGGHRLIGIFASYQRLFMRLQVPRLRAWETAAVPDPFLAAGAGRSPVDPVWYAEIAAEVGTAEGKVASLVSLDLQAFYEHIRHEDLASRVLSLAFPLGVLRCALRAYRCNRHIVHQGIFRRLLHLLKASLPDAVPRLPQSRPITRSPLEP